MSKLRIKIIPEGTVRGRIIPLSIVFVEKREILAVGLDGDEAIHAVARNIPGPVGVNILDLEAVTTTSDGIMVDGAIVKMGAADGGKVNPDFGILAMAEIPFSRELIKAEPHLRQWQAHYPGRRLYRGPDPRDKIIPVHNVVITGRAANNNSATEMMNIITMEEILLPFLGQVQCVRGGDILLGETGEVISVGIGMTTAELYGRVFPSRQFPAGETAHGSGAYAKTLKRQIPCIVADKAVLAGYTLRAMECGCVPGREIGCSPAVLTLAKLAGYPIAFDNITPRAWEELASVGITPEKLRQEAPVLTRQEILERADQLIPGVENPVKLSAGELVEEREIHLG